VVNTILVDFRALDTLGEITVIAAAAAAIVSLVRFSEQDAVPRPAKTADVDGIEKWDGIGMIDSVILRTANTFLAPIMVVASLWLLVRGHDAVGGGFIGGLTAGAAVVLLYFSQGHQRIWQSRWLQSLLFAGGGLLVAIAWGVGGLVGKGSFLTGAKFTLPFGVEVAGSLVFDIGVYGVVIGIVVAILRHLGQGIAEEPPERGSVAADRGTRSGRPRRVGKNASDQRGAPGAGAPDATETDAEVRR
jgi:multicomponent Na+:H+ antiporter subunit A